ncbi:putative porin [Thiobacillus thioparus]|uniref:putative porin n=1 Tax=Thiobacillus thioparus TaxID=931 RepID=UPI0003778D59|nr:putative porin [Thiobacillus thioparus]
MKTHYIKPLVMALSLFSAMPVQAANERQELETLRATTLALVDALVKQGVLSAEVAQDLIKQAEKKGQEQAEASAKAEAASGVVRVPYIPEVVKREISEQIRQEVVAQAKTEHWGDVNAVPEWVERLKWEGDIRLRFQDDLYAKGNDIPNSFAGYGINLNNTSETRERLRLRARLGLLAKITDNVSAGFRITTGDTSDPVSTNQTLGTTFNKYSLVLDRAYAKVTPWEWLSVSGGRIPHPFFSTDLVWDDDVNFEGAAASFTPWSRENWDWKPFATIGAFPLQSVESSPTNLAKNKWLYAAQLGLNWRAGPDTRWRFGLAYYDYRNIKGIPNTDPFQPHLYDATAPGYRQKGNSLFDISLGGTGTWALAADYQLANLTAMVDLAQFEPVHVILTGDVVKNIGYDSAEVQQRMGAGYQARTLGWNTKLTVGMPKVDKEGDWQAFLGYRNLQRDATLDAFTDSDFNLGGTNSKGFYLGGLYGIDRNSWLGVKWLSADSIDGPLSFGVDVLQVDFNAKF